MAPTPETEYLERLIDQEWLKTRPQCIKDLIAKLPPWHVYRIKKTLQECEIVSYFENGTVEVLITNGSRASNWEPYLVFGYTPGQLEQITTLGNYDGPFQNTDAGN